jgi:hypothetical protein
VAAHLTAMDCDCPALSDVLQAFAARMALREIGGTTGTMIAPGSGTAVSRHPAAVFPLGQKESFTMNQ